MPTFVQFMHPGGEHGPDRDGFKGWNWGDHRRKFLRAEGTYLEDLDSSPAEAELGFWAEWEPESDVEPIEERDSGGPHWLHTPFYVKPDAYLVDNQVRQNTDPFVFGDRFLYTLCRQWKQTGPTQLRDLEPGSVVVFGSCKSGEFVVDTVLVTSDSRLHNLRNWPKEIGSRVSGTFRDVTLRPTYAWEDPDIELRLYEGATPDEPVEGMFSYVPALPLQNAPEGFARPVVNARDLITPNLAMGFKATRLSNDEIRSAWRAVAEQITNQDLVLATRFALPERREEPSLGGGEVIHQSFVAFVQATVLPARAANPTHRRLDGQLTGGNRSVFGEFRHHDKCWKVHADTHYEPLLVAYETAKTGTDPFVESRTRSGLSLDLTDDLRAKLSEPQYKYIYIYEIPSR